MKWYFLFFSVLLSTVIFAQADVVVISSKGKVWYQKSNTDAKKTLIPGQKIKALGALSLDDNSQVTLLSSGKTYQLYESGTHQLNKVIPAESQKKMGFGSRFWSFLTDGLINSDNKHTLDEYHKQHMSVAGGVKGFAGPDLALSPLLPTYGKLGPGVIEFQWTPIEQKEIIYQFDIVKTSGKKLIYRALYKPSLVKVDLRPLVLSDEENYQWIVKALDRKTMTVIDSIMPAAPVEFQYILNTDMAIAESLEYVEGYEEGDEYTRSWMEAVAMEQEGFPYLAYRRFLKLRIMHPEDLLIKKLFAAFLVRHNQLDAAQEMLEQ